MKHDARKMRLVRESMGMTQEKLAILSNVSERTVQRAEAGANMRLNTLADFAAALEIPISELVIEPEDRSADKDVGLRRVMSARALVDDLAKAGVATFDCDVEPTDTEMEPLLAVVDLVENHLPRPWDLEQQPAASSLSDRIRLAARLRALIEALAAGGIGLYAATSWIHARYPTWDSGEGCRCTYDNQPFQKVMTLQITIAREADDKVYRKPHMAWGLDQLIAPSELTDRPSFGADPDEIDTPF